MSDAHGIGVRAEESCGRESHITMKVRSRRRPIVRATKSKQAKCPKRYSYFLISLLGCGLTFLTVTLVQSGSLLLFGWRYAREHHMDLRHAGDYARYVLGHNRSVNRGKHTALTCPNCVSAFKPSLRATYCGGDCAWTEGPRRRMHTRR